MPIDSLTPYLKRYGAKWRWMPRDELERFDEWFSLSMHPFLREIAEDACLTDRETEEFIDLMYKVMLAKEEFDLRYDNVLIADAVNRVRKEPRECPRRSRWLEI